MANRWKPVGPREPKRDWLVTLVIFTLVVSAGLVVGSGLATLSVRLHP